MEPSWKGVKLFFVRRDDSVLGGRWRFTKGQARVKKLTDKDKEKDNQDPRLGRRNLDIGDIY